MNNGYRPDIVSCEALINCWIREGKSLDELKLDLDVSSKSLMGDVRLTELPTANGVRVSPLALAKLMVDNIMQNESYRSAPDWQENLESSVRVLRQLEGLGAATLKNPTAALGGFIASEQGFWHGHRFHPSPKSRLGFDDDDLKTFSPEVGQSFRLHYFGVRSDAALVDADPSFARFWRLWCNSSVDQTAGGNSNDMLILPLHPWQAKLTLRHPQAQAAIRHGALIDFGIQGPLFRATSSVRTLYQEDADFFIKASLDVRITNCFRRNTPSDLRAARAISRLLTSDVLPHHDESEEFQILPEPAYIDVDWPRATGIAGSTQVGAPYLGALFRSGLKHLEMLGGASLLAAAIFGDRDLSIARMANVLDASGLSGRAWFSQYARLIITPVLQHFVINGIMLEPHLQNIIVRLDHEWRPSGIIQRDLENARIVPMSAAWHILKIEPPQVHKFLSVEAETSWPRLLYCLLVNNLSEAVYTISRAETYGDEYDGTRLEARLWEAAYEVINEIVEDASDPVVRRYARRLLEEECLPAKKNLHTRVTRIADRNAEFAGLPNPLRRRPTLGRARDAGAGFSTFTSP